MSPKTCKHFNGAFHNEACGAGVRFADVTPEWETRQRGRLLRLPCKQACDFKTAGQVEEFQKRGTCPKYEEPTAEEIEADEAETKALVARMQLTFAVTDKMKREHKGKDWKGVETCPVCGGKLHMTHSAYNGHVWGKCETEDCVSWME